MGESKIVRRGGSGGETLIPEQFIDTSGSAGSAFPYFWDESKGIAFYGLVSASDLFTSTELSNELNVTSGTVMENEALWHKYYWNGGIHFWRKPVRHSISWDALDKEGHAIYGTGTTTSRKGVNNTTESGDVQGVTQNQDAEVVKNNITYIVRLMEGSSADPVDINQITSGSFSGRFENPLLKNSEFNLIMMNLHVATNPGFYDGSSTFGSTSTTDGITYKNWSYSDNWDNNEFIGLKTNYDDSDFIVSGLGMAKWFQETVYQNNRFARAIGDSLDMATSGNYQNTGINYGAGGNTSGWLPVLTVKDSSFVTYGKSGGFNQSEPDW